MSQYKFLSLLTQNNREIAGFVATRKSWEDVATETRELFIRKSIWHSGYDSYLKDIQFYCEMLADTEHKNVSLTDTPSVALTDTEHKNVSLTDTPSVALTDTEHKNVSLTDTSSVALTDTEHTSNKT